MSLLVRQSTLQAFAMYTLVRKSFPVIFSQVNIINTRGPFIGSSWFQTRNSSNEKANDGKSYILNHQLLKRKVQPSTSVKFQPGYVGATLILFYKERFSWLVKSFEKIRNRLVIFLKIKEQKSWGIAQKHIFPQKMPHFRINCRLKGENGSK